MFRFHNPYMLYMLLLIPLLVALFIYGNLKQRRRLKEFGNPEILRGEYLARAMESANGKDNAAH